MEEPIIVDESTLVNDRECQSVKLLAFLGIQNSGYYFFKSALALPPDAQMCVTKICILYEKIAKIHHVSAEAVERAMRNAVKKAYDEQRLQNFNKLMGVQVIYCQPKICELLPMLWDYLGIILQCA